MSKNIDYYDGYRLMRLFTIIICKCFLILLIGFTGCITTGNKWDECLAVDKNEPTVTTKMKEAVDELVSKLPESGTILKIDYGYCKDFNGKITPYTHQITERFLSLLTCKLNASSLDDRIVVEIRDENESELFDIRDKMKKGEKSSKLQKAYMVCKVGKKVGSLFNNKVIFSSRIIFNKGAQSVIVVKEWFEL